MKAKIKIWLKRYVPAEISAIIGALILGLGLNMLFHNPVLTAFGGTWGDSIGYYSTIIFRDLRKQKEKYKKISTLIFIKTIRNMFLEFGAADFLDTFVIRPFTMYIFPLWLSNLTLGLIVGKFAADIIFYIPTIIAYELRVKFGKD